jgi:FixJ family two-component response regulator
VRNAPLIAIVDDSVSMREALRGLVLSLGYEAAVFESAEQFLACATDRLINCIILDVVMPGLSGLELQAELGRRGTTTPVIFVTSRNDGATKAAAMSGGALSLLGKPVDDAQLIQCLHAALGTRTL